MCVFLLHSKTKVDVKEISVQHNNILYDEVTPHW